MVTISRDEWLEALGEANRPEVDPLALTAKEIGVLLRLKQNSAIRRAERLVEEGKAIEMTKIVSLSNGVPRRVRAWKLLKPKK